LKFPLSASASNRTATVRERFSVSRTDRDRSLTVAALLAFALFWFAGCGSTRQAVLSPKSDLEQTHITIGLAVPGATYLPLYVAVDQGTFARQWLQADLVEFRGGSDLIKAVVSKSVDVGVVSLAEITSGIDAGQPLKAFYAGFNIPDFDWYGASSIKSLANAKGKRIGITQYGSSTDFITRYALAVNGLDPSKDVQIIQAGPPATRLAAMQAGQLDICIFSTPEKFLAEERGYKLIYSQKQLSDDYPQHLIFATEPFLNSHPNTVKALLRGHAFAVRLAKENEDLAERSLIKHLQIDPKYAERTYSEIIDHIYEDGRLPSEKSLDVFFDMGIKAGRYKERWPDSRFWTPIYVDSYSHWMPAPPRLIAPGEN
jgi:NitT/TauT family transport system substrate-binding protein